MSFEVYTHVSIGRLPYLHLNPLMKSVVQNVFHIWNIKWQHVLNVYQIHYPNPIWDKSGKAIRLNLSCTAVRDVYRAKDYKIRNQTKNRFANMPAR